MRKDGFNDKKALYVFPSALKSVHFVIDHNVIAVQTNNGGPLRMRRTVNLSWTSYLVYPRRATELLRGAIGSGPRATTTSPPTGHVMDPQRTVKMLR